MRDDVKELMRARLQQAGATIACAAELLRTETEIFDQYAKEVRLMDSVGPVVAPGLFVDPERRAVDAVLRPLFAAALEFVRAYDLHTAAARGLLEKVKEEQA